MAGLIVLVTGVTRFIGSALAGRLAEHPMVDRVIGVDAALPEPAARARMGAADFARVDIRNPLVARVIEAAGVDTVVHASASSTPASSAARSMAKEMNVLGTMQLLAACQRSESVRNLIVRSTGAVYGASSRDPAIFTEEMSARSVPSSGPGRDAIDIEAYVRGFGRRRPDVRIAVPRLADVIGPTVVTPLTRYFALSPVVPMVLGRDARLQLVHETDAVGVLEHLAVGDFSGTVNVAGDGAITLAQAIHRAGRIPLPVPSLSLDGLSRVMRTVRMGGFSPGRSSCCPPGGCWTPPGSASGSGTCPGSPPIEAFDDFAASLRPALAPETVRRVEVRLAGALGARPLPDVAGDGRAGRIRRRAVAVADAAASRPDAAGRPRRTPILRMTVASRARPAAAGRDHRRRHRGTAPPEDPVSMPRSPVRTAISDHPGGRRNDQCLVPRSRMAPAADADRAGQRQRRRPQRRRRWPHTGDPRPRRPPPSASRRPTGFPRVPDRNRLEARPGQLAGLRPAPDDRRLRGRRLRLRPGLHRQRHRAAAEGAVREVVPDRDHRHGEHPGHRRCAAGGQPFRAPSRSTH